MAGVTGRRVLTGGIIFVLVAVSVVIGVYQSKIAWYLGKSKGGVAGDDVCCPGGKIGGRLCEEPRRTMHNILNKYFSFWAWEAQIFQLVFAVMAFVLIAWYVQPHKVKRSPPTGVIKTSGSFQAFNGVTIIILLLVGIGVQFNFAYSQIENSQWEEYWGQPSTTITGDAPIYTAVQNGTADCYNNVGKKGPNFVGFSWVILCLWMFEVTMFVIGMIWMIRLNKEVTAVARMGDEMRPFTDARASYPTDVHDLSFNSRARASSASSSELHM
jgi:hypothetical protein